MNLKYLGQNPLGQSATMIYCNTACSSVFTKRCDVKKT